MSELTDLGNIRRELIRQTEEISANAEKQTELLQGIYDELRELRRMASVGEISVYVMKP
jgi:hypothetical protein